MTYLDVTHRSWMSNGALLTETSSISTCGRNPWKRCILFTAMKNDLLTIWFLDHRGIHFSAWTRLLSTIHCRDGGFHGGKGLPKRTSAIFFYGFIVTFLSPNRFPRFQSHEPESTTQDAPNSRNLQNRTTISCGTTEITFFESSHSLPVTSVPPRGIGRSSSSWPFPTLTMVRMPPPFVVRAKQKWMLSLPCVVRIAGIRCSIVSGVIIWSPWHPWLWITTFLLLFSIKP